MYSIAMVLFGIFSHWKIQNGNGNSVQLIEEEDVQEICKLAKSLSIFNLIHYFPFHKEKQEEKKEESTIQQQDQTQTEQSMNGNKNDIEEPPCPEHTDTGILTLIPVASVAGLQVWDKTSGKWIEIEKLFGPNNNDKINNHECIICIVGEKVPLFCNNWNFQACLHRVVRTNLQFAT